MKTPGWRLSVDTLDGKRTLCVIHEEGVPMPGFTRYRTFAWPAGEDLAASLREFAETDDALRKPLAKAHGCVETETVPAPGADSGETADAPAPDPETRLEPGREVERIEWRIDAGGTDILATFEPDGAGRTALRLAAPAANGALDAIFALAGEIVDAASISIAPRSARARDRAGACIEARSAAHGDAPGGFRHDRGVGGRTVVRQRDGGTQRLGDEHIYQLRVAQRRLKTLLKLFRDYVDEAWNTRIAPDLKWFGDLLADARDWDVLTDRTLPAWASRRQPGALAGAHRGRRREAARHARSGARRALASKRYARLTLAFVEGLARFASQEDDVPIRFVSYAEKRIRKDYHYHYRRIADVPDLVSLEPHERHRVRIHAKRLRYALEFFRLIISKRTRTETARLLGELQAVLGEANDAAVAADRLASIPEATDYQRGFARAWGAASARHDAQEGERLLRSIPRSRIRVSL